jgi:hypothetical protein
MIIPLSEPLDKGIGRSGLNADLSLCDDVER